MDNIVISARIHHVAIQTACFERAFQFYHEILGIRVAKEPFNYKGRRMLAWLDAGSVMIELYSVKSGNSPQPYNDCRVGTDHIAFEVKNIEEVIIHLSEQGVKVLKQPFYPPTDDPDQPRVAFIEGPDGEEIELREF